MDGEWREKTEASAAAWAGRQGGGDAQQTQNRCGLQATWQGFVYSIQTNIRNRTLSFRRALQNNEEPIKAALWRSVRWKFPKLSGGAYIVCFGYKGRLSTPGHEPRKSLEAFDLGAGSVCGSFVSDAFKYLGNKVTPLVEGDHFTNINTL